MDMLRLRVRQVAVEKGWNLSKLQREAKLTTGVARRYWYGTRSGSANDTTPLREISLETLAVVAKTLQVQPGDLLE
jgi:DNA-binding Xre family transcriptional regulator